MHVDRQIHSTIFIKNEDCLDLIVEEEDDTYII